MSNTMPIIEIVKCKSGRVAQKWSSESQICKHRSTKYKVQKVLNLKFS